MCMCPKSIILKSQRPTNSSIYFLLRNTFPSNYHNVLSKHISGSGILHIYGQKSIKMLKLCSPNPNYSSTPALNVSTSTSCYKQRKSGENKVSA